MFTGTRERERAERERREREERDERERERSGTTHAHVPNKTHILVGLRLPGVTICFGVSVLRLVDAMCLLAPRRGFLVMLGRENGDSYEAD